MASVLALALVPASASAAVPGVNVSRVNDYGDPYVNAPGILPGSPSDTARAWNDVVASGARSIRTFVPWQLDAAQLTKYEGFASKARAHGLAVDLVVTGSAADMATPAAYAQSIGTLAAHLRGEVAAYEVWNEPDDAPFWQGAPQPAAYAALLKAAFKAVHAADPAAKVLVGGLVGNDVDFVEGLYANGAGGAFDGVAVHTDTACNTTDPTEYYREPNGRIGRYSFTGYREIRKAMLAHGDDRPVWMTELGWSTTPAVCSVGLRAGTKPGGVGEDGQATFLTKAYECLADDPYVQQGMWFNLHDFDTSGTSFEQRLGLVDDAFRRKPAFAAFAHAGALGGIPCGGTMDDSAPAVRIVAPRDGTPYYSSVPVHIHAEDAQGIQDVNLSLDGRNVPFTTPKGRTSDIRLSVRAAGALAFGPHRLVATARDEARNVGRASVAIVRVGGGAYTQRIPTALRVRYGTVKRRRMAVSGRVRFAGGVRGDGEVEFRFDRRVKGRWKTRNVWHRTAHRPFRFTFGFGNGGQWRVRTRFMPKGPFAPATAGARLLRIR
jgi:Bacterial Ig domain